jgi:hypothetical protein
MYSLWALANNAVMATEIVYIEDQTIIASTPGGVLDLDFAKALLREIDQMAQGLKVDFGILIDMRRVESRLTVDDHWYLAVEFDHFPATFAHRTAFVSPRDRSDPMAFLARAAEFRGFPVRAFTTIGTAIDWLTAP